MSRNREVWPDAVKIIACTLVVIGHFTQSMVKSGFMSDGALYWWLQDTICSFHVPLFFICSGYLYQRYSRVDSPTSWWLNARKKALALGVPYLVFTCVTLALKVLAGDFANTQEAGPLKTLLFEPTAPYWYLYTLFFLFLVIPTAGSRRMCAIIFAVAAFAKALSLSGALPSLLPYALTSVMANGVWFALGMSLASLGWLERLGRRTAAIGLVFLPLSVALYVLGAGPAWWFATGLLACLCVVSVCRAKFIGGGSPVVVSLARWTMPVYLMHTIFSAGWRVVLLKLGIASAPVHIVTGLVIGFVAPVAAAIVLERLKPLDFVMYPARYIELKPKGNRSDV